MHFVALSRGTRNETIVHFMSTSEFLCTHIETLFTLRLRICLSHVTVLCMQLPEQWKTHKTDYVGTTTWIKIFAIVLYSTQVKSVSLDHLKFYIETTLDKNFRWALQSFVHRTIITISIKYVFNFAANQSGVKNAMQQCCCITDVPI